MIVERRRSRGLAAWVRPESRCRRGMPGWTVGVTRQRFCGAVDISDRSD